MEASGKRQSQDLILCACQAARASCQGNEGFRSEEIREPRWAGKTSEGQAHHSACQSPPCFSLLFPKHYSEQDRQDSCFCGTCRGGFEEPGNRKRRKDIAGIKCVPRPFSELGYPSHACRQHHLLSASGVVGDLFPFAVPPLSTLPILTS